MNLRNQSLKSIRLFTLLFPPLGLLLLWASASLKIGRKILGTIGILFFSLLYAAFIIGILMLFTGLEIEWRGGYPPSFTYHKTRPDYNALEKSRASQRKSGTAPLPLAAAPTARVPYWTDFRGPKRDGHYDEQPILTQWPSAGLRLLWRQPIGGGYSSFTVASGMAFTLEQRRDEEAITAYDLETGREIWAHAYAAHFDESMGGDGPRSTPTYHAGKLYSLGAQGDLLCLEARNGNVVWKRDILADNHAINLYYGMSSSPLIVDEKVIVQPGGTNGQSVAAYDKETGTPLWKSLDDPAAYSSPMLVELAGRRQLLVVTEHRAVGLEVETGKLLWEFPWVVAMKNRNIAQPVLLSSNRFFLSAGYGTGCAAVEVSRSGPGFSAREIWRNKSLKNKFSSSVFQEGFLYGLDEDILTCLDAATGVRKWKDGRYGYGQLLLAGGHLVILSGEGEVALVKATPEKYAELGRFQAIAGKTWNYPALAQGRLLVRNALEMACFDLSMGKPAGREAD